MGHPTPPAWYVISLRPQGGHDALRRAARRHGAGLLALSRKTAWDEPLEGFYTGLGQRVFTTDTGDVSLMDVRSITWNTEGSTEASTERTTDAPEAPAGESTDS